MAAGGGARQGGKEQPPKEQRTKRADAPRKDARTTKGVKPRAHLSRDAYTLGGVIGENGGSR